MNWGKSHVKLGSDVPFMLHGGTAVGRGHGDEITPALSRGTYSLGNCGI